METECRVPIEGACEYVTSECQDFYIAWLYYCFNHHALLILAISVLLILGFLSLGIVTSNFLSPNLTSVSDWLGLDQRISGMTLLSLGNGSPDIFSTYSAMTSNSTSLAIGELLGSSLFVCSFVIGSMAMACPFEVRKSQFVRDIIFFTSLLLISLFFIQDGVLALWECATMALLYIAYLCFLIYSPAVALEEPQILCAIQRLSPMSRNNSVSSTSNVASRTLYDNLATYLDVGTSFRLSVFDALKIFNFEKDHHRSPSPQPKTCIETTPLIIEPDNQYVIHHPTPTRVIDPNALDVHSSFEVMDQQFNWIDCLFPEIRALDFWKLPFESVLAVVSCPIIFLISATTPVVPPELFSEDATLEKEMRFKRQFFSFQLVLLSLLVDVSGLSFVVGTILALANATYCSQTKPSSKYYFLVSLVGFAGSLVWITKLASAIVTILKNLGVILQIDETLLGLTVLALGNSVGDLISNVTLCTMGFHHTGLSACFGAPLLYVLLGVGVNGIIVMLRDHKTEISFQVSKSLVVSSVGLLFILLVYLVVVTRNGWRLGRKTGMFAVCWWLVVTSVNVVLEVR